MENSFFIIDNFMSVFDTYMKPCDVDFKAILFKGKKVAGKNPVMLQFKISDGVYKRIRIKVYGTPDEWSKEAGIFTDQRNRGEDNKKILTSIDKARTILEEMQRDYEPINKYFDFQDFKYRFQTKDKLLARREKSKIPSTLLGFLAWYIKLLTKQDRIGDRACFKTLLSILKSQKVSESFSLDKIDKHWLEDFKLKLIARKNRKGEPISSVTVWSYLKTLRTLLSKARYYEVTFNNPFRNSTNPNGFAFHSLERTARISRTLSDEELESFFAFDWLSSSKREKLAYLTCYLIYLFRGIPISDLALLNLGDIHNNEISFGRVKTHKKVPNIPISEKRTEIMDLLKPFTDGYYIIPILRKDTHITKQQKYNRIGKIKTYINKSLKMIAEKQGIKINLTTYTFRHTYARKVLERHGIWKLKEALGHESILTTQKYAGSLSDKEVAITDDVFDDIF